MVSRGPIRPAYDLAVRSGHGGSRVGRNFAQPHQANFLLSQMAVALTATGWWIYIDQAITPNAVVVCVIIFNAAFGYSWGPIPWLCESFSAESLTDD